MKKWIPATALFAVMIGFAAPAHAAGLPTHFTSFLTASPQGFGGSGGTNNPLCPTSPENPTILLAAFALAGVYFGRKVKRSANLQTVAAGR